jgi:hypothetical protein
MCSQAEFDELCTKCPAKIENDGIRVEFQIELQPKIQMSENINDFLFDFVPDACYLKDFLSETLECYYASDDEDSSLNSGDCIDHAEFLGQDRADAVMVECSSQSSKSSKSPVSGMQKRSGSSIRKHPRSSESTNEKDKRRREQNREAQRRLRHRAFQICQRRTSQWLQESTYLMF